MAGLDEIINQIIKDANEQAEAIAQSANMQISENAEKSKKLAQVQTDEILKKAEADCMEEERRFHALSGLASRKEELQVKRNSIDETFSLARQKILAMEDERYRSFLFHLLQKCGAREGTLLASKRDERFFDQAFLQKANRELDMQIRLGGVRESLPTGFILAQGDTEINCSLENIFNQAQSELEGQVARILFER